MLEEALDRLEARARGANPAVRAGALMRIARVRTALNRQRARDLFESALGEIRTFPGRDRSFLLEEARQVAAAVAPDLLQGVETGRRHRHFEAESIGRIMIDHGQIDAAVDYVIGYQALPDFPYFTALALLQKLDNDEQRRAILRKAISTGREVPSDHFIDFFSWAWTRLSNTEARDVLREVVRYFEEQPDRGISATYDPERTVEITSVREHFFFRLLHILRKLEPALAESLIGRYEQLGAAARRFPNGIESVTEEAQKRRPEIARTGESCGGYGMVGDPQDFPYLRSLLDGQRSREFDSSMQYAIEKYRSDTNPTDLNQAPKHFWPSTCAFRQILYAAGHTLRQDAAQYLGQIVDEDLRMYAEIEMFAAIASLPQFQGVQREFRPQRHLDNPATAGELTAGVRCPKCNWTPRVGNRWNCKCGHIWNTFETRGICPACNFAWQVTMCFQCGEASRHADWYTHTLGDQA